MSDSYNTRGVILDILMEVNREGQYSHIVLRDTLNRYQYLPQTQRAFINRTAKGTIENMLQIDYIINMFSSVPITKMKPVIQNILRMGVYQLKYMDFVPNSAVCNEAVKLTQKRGFYNLKGFVNAILRNVAANMPELALPKREDDICKYLSVRYSMPEWIVIQWIEKYGCEICERMLASFMEEAPLTIRVRQYRTDKEEVLDSIKSQGATLLQAPYLPYAYYLSNYNNIRRLKAFIKGEIFIQDISSMLVSEIASPKKGNYIIDMCAAPGGKSLHLADKMGAFGVVEARDLTEYRTALINENIQRADVINVHTVIRDALVFDRESVDKADIVLADVPCSGLGVIGKKVDIKYKTDPGKIRELAELQKSIISNAVKYVKPGGTFIYSTCTISDEENYKNIMWLTENFPYRLDSIDPYICDELKCDTTAKGFLQLLPGVHNCDGFFMARFKRLGG